MLSVQPHEISETVRECMRVNITSDAGATENAHFTVVPQFKHRSEGDYVDIGDAIILTNPSWPVVILQRTFLD